MHFFIFFSLTLSLPECLMEFCKVTLTFDSADKILWCDHSNESSLPVLTHGAICFSKFHKMKPGNLVEICFRLNLAVKGLKRKKRVIKKKSSEERRQSHMCSSLAFSRLYIVGLQYCSLWPQLALSQRSKTPAPKNLYFELSSTWAPRSTCSAHSEYDHMPNCKILRYLLWSR